MFGIRKALKRAFSIETIATAVERKIASDMAADPTHPRNAAGVEMIASIQAVRAQAIARRELESLLPDYNRRAAELKEAIDHFDGQSPEWREAHPEVRNKIEGEYKVVSETADHIRTLSSTAKSAITAVKING